MKLKIPVLLALLITPAGSAVAQKSANDYYRESIEAYRNGDTEGFYRAAVRADSLRPWHPVLSYNLAAAHALRGEEARALELLCERSLLYADTLLAGDPDFESLRDTPAWSKLMTHLKELNRPIRSSTPYMELWLPGFHAEGLAWDPRNRTFLAGDIRSGLIVAFDTLGRAAREIINLGAEGYWSVFGMEVDPGDPSLLWVTTAALPEFGGYQDSLDGRSALLAVDLDRGAILRRYELPGVHHFSDLEIGGDGTVYLSDGRDPAVYVLPPGGTAPEPLVRHPGFQNLQGVALNAAGDELYVADYRTGVYRIRLTAGEAGNGVAAEPLEPGNNHLLKGTDGLYWHNGILYAIQNGTVPMRLVAVNTVSGVGELRTIDRALDIFNEPTTGFFLKNNLYYIANSPWRYYGEDHNPLPGGWPRTSILRYVIE